MAVAGIINLWNSAAGGGERSSPLVRPVHLVPESHESDEDSIDNTASSIGDSESESEEPEPSSSELSHYESNSESEEPEPSSSELSDSENSDDDATDETEVEEEPLVLYSGYKRRYRSRLVANMDVAESESSEDEKGGPRPKRTRSMALEDRLWRVRTAEAEECRRRAWFSTSSQKLRWYKMHLSAARGMAPGRSPGAQGIHSARLACSCRWP